MDANAYLLLHAHGLYRVFTSGGLGGKHDSISTIVDSGGNIGSFSTGGGRALKGGKTIVRAEKSYDRFLVSR